MNEVEKSETTTETTNVNVDSADAGANVDVSTEKSVEQNSAAKPEDTAAPESPESNVNVKVENNFPGDASAPTHDPNKNYEAAQPVTEPLA